MPAWSPDPRQTRGSIIPVMGSINDSILEKLLAAMLADQMPHMGGLIGQGLAKCPVGDSAGAKGLPEGLARFLGYDVLAVVAGDQYHQMVGFDPALVAEVDLTLFARLALGCHGRIRSRCGWRAHHNLLRLALNSPFRGCIEA